MRVGRYVDAIRCATRLISRAEQDMRINRGVEEFKGEGIGSLAMALEKVDLRRRWKELKPLLLNGLDIARHFDTGRNNYWVVQHQETLGICAARMKEFDQAFAWLQGAVHSIRSFTPEPSFFRSRIYQHFSTLARLQNDHDEAIKHALSAIEIAEQNATFSAQLRAMSQLTLAEAELARGNGRRAHRIASEVVSNVHVKTWYVERQRAEFLLSNLEREFGHLEKARQAACNALTLAVEMGMKEEEVLCSLSRGRTEIAMGATADACNDFEHALILSEERKYEDHRCSAVSYISDIKQGPN